MSIRDAAAFNPLWLSPRQWIDSSDTSTLYDATSGGSLVAANGAIARIEDKSGNGYHYTQLVLNDRPVRKDNQVNGRSVADLDGATDYMQSTITGFQSYTALFILDVFSSTAAAASNTNSVILWSWGNISTASGPFPANRALFLASNSSALASERIHYGAEAAQVGRLGSTTYTRSANKVQALYSEFSASGTTMRSDNALVTLNVTSSITTSTNITPSAIGYVVDDILFLGAARVGGSISEITPAMQLCERVVLNYIPTADQRTALQSYVANKWGIV